MACDWLFIDGPSLIFRAFHGVPASVRAPDGSQVNAVRGFMDTLARLISRRRPRHLAIAADADWRPAWRVALIPAYKLHRTLEPVPSALAPQMPVIDSLMAAAGIDVAGVPEFEAEDVIATWVTQAVDSQITGASPQRTTAIEIASGDRDLFALVDGDHVLVLYPERGGVAVVDEAEVQRRYGIPGRLYADFAVLRGDPSDGLPGLKGVGAVSAAQMVRKHGGVEGVLRDGALGAADRDYLERAVRVVRPVRTVPVALPVGSRERYPADAGAFTALVERYGLSTVAGHLVDALNGVVGPAAPEPAGREHA